MENASKALIIAGTIIIVMIVIAAGMYLFNSAGGLSASVQSKWSDDEILNFNRQFTKYEGTQKGSSVKELIETVNESKGNNIQVKYIISIKKILKIAF